MSPGGTVDPQRRLALDLVEADRCQPDAPDDDRGLAGLVGEHPQGRVGMTDEPLAADVGAGADEQLRSDPEEPAVPVDEAEIAERPEVAVDRRERHVERRTELVGADLTAIRHGQQETQAAGERGVLGGFLGWPVARGGHAGPRGNSHSAGINPGPGW